MSEGNTSNGQRATSNERRVPLVILLAILAGLAACVKDWQRSGPFDPGRGAATVTATATPLLPTLTCTPTATPFLVDDFEAMVMPTSDIWETFSRNGSAMGGIGNGTGGCGAGQTRGGHMSCTLTPAVLFGTAQYLADLFVTAPVSIDPLDYQFLEVCAAREPESGTLNDIAYYAWLACADGDEYRGDVTSQLILSYRVLRVHLGTDDLVAQPGNLHPDVRLESAITSVGFIIEATSPVTTNSDSVKLHIDNLRFY